MVSKSCDGNLGAIPLKPSLPDTQTTVLTTHSPLSTRGPYHYIMYSQTPLHYKQCIHHLHYITFHIFHINTLYIYHTITLNIQHTITLCTALHHTITLCTARHHYITLYISSIPLHLVDSREYSAWFISRNHNIPSYCWRWYCGKSTNKEPQQLQQLS